MKRSGASIARPWGRGDVVGLVLAACATLGLLAVVGRVAQLQASPGPRLSEWITDRMVTRALPAPRGDLMDRRGRLLASTSHGYRVVVDPETFPRNVEASGPKAEELRSRGDRAVVSLAAALGLSPDEVGGRIMGAIAANEAARAASGAASPTAESEADAARRILDRLAAALDRVLGAPDEGASAAAAGEDDASGAAAGPKVRRYLPVGGIISREQAKTVQALKLSGVRIETRPVRSYNAPPEAAALVGKVNVDNLGVLGAEAALDERLEGQDGSLRLVGDAWGRPLWLPQGAVEAPQRGADVRLSIDLTLQTLASEELARGVEEADAAGGRLVAVEPRTGEILAMVDILREVPEAVPYPWVDPKTPRETWPTAPAETGPRKRYVVIRPDPMRASGQEPALARNRCVEDAYEPGSTFKSFVWASALAAGILKPGEIVTGTGRAGYVTPYGRVFKDVGRATSLDWDGVLVNSSNVGMVKISERMTHEQLRGVVTRFGFGRRTGLPLPGESPGLTTSARDWSKYTQSSVSIGHEVAVTPVQMARAFSSLARSGDLAGTLPRLRLVSPSVQDLDADPVERVLPREVAERTRRVLAGVVVNSDEKMQKRFPEEGKPAYVLFGKSGTAVIPLTPPPGLRRPRGTKGYFLDQYNSSFVAGGPLEEPRLVVLVVIDDPGPVRVRNKEHYGSDVAAPVVRRVMERALRYLGAEPDAGRVEVATAGVGAGE